VKRPFASTPYLDALHGAPHGQARTPKSALQRGGDSRIDVKHWESHVQQKLQSTGEYRDSRPSCNRLLQAMGTTGMCTSAYRLARGRGE